MGDLKRRFTIWWHDALRPWWLVVSAAFVVLANLDTLISWAGFDETFGVRVLLSRVTTRTWLELWLLVTVGVLLESVYRVALARDTARSDLNRKRQNQVLSDVLSDKHEHGIHELLNKQPQTQQEFEGWLKLENEWLKSVLSIMREHGCTKQQIRYVHTLGIIQMIPLHKDPLISHRLSMLVMRLSRIADVARQYGE